MSRGDARVRLVLAGPVRAEDVPALCARALELFGRLERGPIACDVSGLRGADLVLLDVLCRLQLAALRTGRILRLEHARPDLVRLLERAGLTGVLPCGPWSGLEPRRQVEEREDPPGVEEERDAGDGPV